MRICLLIAALNDLDVQSGDIENAYLKRQSVGKNVGHVAMQHLVVTKGKSS